MGSAATSTKTEGAGEDLISDNYAALIEGKYKTQQKTTATDSNQNTGERENFCCLPPPYLLDRSGVIAFTGLGCWLADFMANMNLAHSIVSVFW